MGTGGASSYSYKKRHGKLTEADIKAHEAKKASSADESLNNFPHQMVDTTPIEQIDLSYQRGHMPTEPSDDFNSRVTELYKGELYPKDFLDHPEWYEGSGDVGSREFNQMMNTIRAMQGNPDMMVTIYRGIDHANLNPGDWVTMSKTYAEQYVGDGGNSPNGKVYEYHVRAGDLSTDGDSIFEMGYWGKRLLYVD